MMTSFNGSGHKGIGVLVLDKDLGFKVSEFLAAAGANREKPPITDVKFVGQRPSWFVWESIPLRSVTCDQLYPRVPRVSLFGIPDGLHLDSLLKDLRFPVQVMGFILIVDLHGVSELEAIWGEETIPFEKAMRAGKLRWIRTNNLPFIVVATGFEPPALSLGELRDLFDLEPQIPIVPCPVLDREHVKQALLTLMEQIEAAGLLGGDSTFTT